MGAESRANIVSLVIAWYGWATDPDAKGTSPPEELAIIAEGMHRAPTLFRDVLDARHDRHKGELDKDIAQKEGLSRASFQRRLAMAYAWADGFAIGKTRETINGQGGNSETDKRR